MTTHRIADALGVHVWELPRVPFHYQEERSAMLVAEYQAKQEKLQELLKAGAPVTEIILPMW